MDSKGESVSVVSEDNLQRAIKSVLTKRNEFNKIRAELRSKIIEIFRENDEDSLNPVVHTNDPNSNNKPQNILNKLILQYFSWFGYKYAAEVFSVESGINQTEIDCSDIVSRINLSKETEKKTDDENDGFDDKDNKDLPILLNLIIKMMIDE